MSDEIPRPKDYTPREMTEEEKSESIESLNQIKEMIKNIPPSTKIKYCCEEIKDCIGIDHVDGHWYVEGVWSTEIRYCPFCATKL